MQPTGEPVRLAERIGVGPSGFKFGRVAALFCAMMLSALALNGARQAVLGYHGTLVVDLYWAVGSALATTVAAAVAFGLIRFQPLALGVAWLLNVALYIPLSWLDVSYSGMEPTLAFKVHLPEVRTLVMVSTWILLHLGALLLAFSARRNAWLKAWLFWCAATLIDFGVFVLVYRKTLDTGDLFRIGPFWLVEAATFVALLWSGLQIVNAPSGRMPRWIAGVTVWGTGFGLGMWMASGIMGSFGARFRLRDVNAAALLIGTPVYLFAIVCTLIFLYKMWAAIQDGQTRVSPGEAVGFVFIPLFNVYWIFRAWWGFSEEFRAYALRHRQNTPPVPGGVLLTYAILTLIGIPLGFTQYSPVAAVPAWAMLSIAVAGITSAVNALGAPGMVRCAGCGGQAPEHTDFCPFCGRRIAAALPAVTGM